DATAHTISAELPTGTDLTAISPVISLSTGATVNPLSGSSQDFTNPVTYTVTAEDGTTTQDWIVTVISPAICSPVSTLACDDIAIAMPYALDFSGDLENTLEDSSVTGTGFTMVLDHSEARQGGDVAISNPLVNGYEPSLLTVGGGSLQILSQRGISFLDPPASSGNNNQVNTLGVGITEMTSSFIVKSSLLNITTGGGGAQAGIWFGFDEDNFVKLDVNNNDNIELRVESEGLSTASDQVQSALGALGQDVILELVLDPTALTAEAYHTIGSSARTLLGTLPVPANYFNGRLVGSENMSFGGVFATHRGGTQFTASFDEFSVRSEEVSTPFFTNVTPANNAIDVIINDFQANVELIIPEGYELDSNTLAGNVNLFVVDPNTQQETLVPSNSNDTGGGDAVTLTPIESLDPLTEYIFRLDSAIEANLIGDLNTRIAFAAFESSFTTGEEDNNNGGSIDTTGISFTQVPGGAALGDGTSGERFSSLEIGPDGKLYGSTIGDFASDGRIFRWSINADGTLSNLEILTPALQGSPHPTTGVNNNNTRLIIGLVFDPASTAENLIAYVSHNMAAITNGPEWDGKISRLSGPNLSVVEDIVINLPRSAKDHLTNSLEFDDLGNMYINQGSNSAGGAPDPIWANRPERLLSGAVLKLDLAKLNTLPLNVFTTDNISTINSAPSTGTTMSDGTYNPYSNDSPLTVFSSGVRNAYDLVWHSNGWLYVPVNGTAGNGINSPNAPGTADYTLAKRIDGLTNITVAPALVGGRTQKDFLHKTQGGDYHGHPNPFRGEFVLNHGSVPYSGLPGQVESVYTDVIDYPNNVAPDVNYILPAYDFGKNKSPNGVIEYKSDAFGDRLSGLLMVVRFSGQDDVLLLNPKADGDIDEAYNSIPGLGGLDDPLDLIEDTRTGNIYVSEYDRDNNGTPRLTLLRASIPATITGKLEASAEEFIFEATSNNEGSNTDVQTISITNLGTSVINISDISITGNFGNQFDAVQPAGITNIGPEATQDFTITYAPDLDETNLGYQDATLVITNDGIDPTVSIPLFALKKKGLEGTDEPTLQAVADVLGVGIDVGWTTLENNVSPTPIGDEISIDRWVRASVEPLVVTPVARYSPIGLLPFGWFTNDGSIVLNEVGVVADGLADAQKLNPSLDSGGTNFDPGVASFGIYVEENAGAPFYTEDAINTPYPHRTRVYPRNDRNGDPIPNSYFIAFEAAFNGDYQDFVFILDNAKPFVTGQSVVFNKSNLNFGVFENQSIVAPQLVTLTQEGGVVVEDIILTASESWVLLPTLEIDAPMEFSIDPTGLSAGNYQATITADLPGNAAALITVDLEVKEDPNFAYQFNFQRSTSLETSPPGFVDDVGGAFATRSTPSGPVNYGWVDTGTMNPQPNTFWGTNNNNGVNIDPLHKTHTLQGLTFASSVKDWVIELPNGIYGVNISVGDPNSSNNYHAVDVNDVTVIDFNEENDNPQDLKYFNNYELVEVTDGTLRMAGNPYGVNVSINYIQIAQLDPNLFPPTITAIFDGNLSSPDTYSGQVDITLDAEDQTGNDAIIRFEYSLDAASMVAYGLPIQVTSVGAHTLLVEAEDSQGNITQETYSFNIGASTGALLATENMTKIPGTNRGFPADNYFSYNRIGSPNSTTGPISLTHDNSVMRLSNPGTSNLIISDILISGTTDFIYSILPGSDSNTTLPITIAPGGTKELNIQFITDLGGDLFTNNSLHKQSMQFVSNADNGGDVFVTLHGIYSPSPGGAREPEPQEVIDVFGLKTSLKSIVNTSGGISPPNPTPFIPVGQFPLPANVNAGYDGDLVLSANFVQADPNQPVRAFNFASFAGSPANMRFIRPNSTTVVGGINFQGTSTWYNSLLSRNSSGVISNDSNSSITEPFRVVIAGRTTSGGTNTSGSNPQMLYARLYKVRDAEGNVVPNDYIGIQDFSGSAGCTPCDWNDNMIYISNIRPENGPSAPSSTTKTILAQESFNIDSGEYLDNGYPGNELTYTALLNGANPLPSWMFFDTSNGAISGTPPLSAEGVNYTIEVNAIDLHNANVTTNVIVNVVDQSPSDLPWLEDFNGISNGSTSDTGETEWTSTRNGGTFSVQNGRFTINDNAGGVSAGTGVWTSEVILINGEVSISIDIDDDDLNGKDPTDFIRAFYVLDGGSPVQFGSVTDDISAQTFSANGLSGSTLQIIVESYVTFTNEFYHFDNVSVISSTALIVSLNDVELQIEAEVDLKLHPNPASGRVWVSLNNAISIAEIEVFDTLGRVSKTVGNEDLINRVTYLLDVSALNSGMYFVKVTDENGETYMKKLLINNE
ncbi:MAG: T9SS type A sorting domain-containing protein, partial [Maribacter sp.]